MVSTLLPHEIPVTRTDCLHILALNEDDLDRLSPGQIAAIRALYFLDSEKTVAEHVLAGDL